MKKESPYRSLDWKFWGIITLLLVAVLFAAYQLGAFKKTCRDDACFNNALAKCSYAKFLATKNLNYYLYTIQGTSKDTCKVEATLRKMAVGTPPDKIEQFEGKGMTCYVPKKDIAKMTSFEFENMLPNCTGQLKEAMYQLMIEKLYTIIIQNMGDIVGAVEDTLKGEI